MIHDNRAGLAERMTRVGIGTARGAEDDDTDAAMFELLSTGLRHGVCVVDTAVNYRSGRSEQVVGQAVRGAIGSGVISRDGVVVMTKLGYPRPAGGAAPVGPPPEPHPARAHCIQPDCVSHSLATSRATLDLDRIDVVYLHNLEELPGTGDEVDRQVRAAIEVLETAAADGWIAGYGMSTWNIGAGVDPARFAGLATQVAGGKSRFTAVQAPLSMLRRDALTPRYSVQAERVSLVALCARLGLVFVASAAGGGGRSPHLAAASVRWVAALPFVGTALVGTLDTAHLCAALGRVHTRAATYS